MFSAWALRVNDAGSAAILPAEIRYVGALTSTSAALSLGTATT